MTDAQPEASTASQASSTTTSTTAAEQPTTTQTGVRNRFARQNINQRPDSSSRPRRRSSILSFTSLEGNSFHDDFIQPSANKRRTDTKDHEITHWSSTPLAFAILPAVSGLVFKNGSAFVTDALLLTLAAVFMNWSIRVPREWYHSAQTIRRDVQPNDNDDDLDDEPVAAESAILEEDENEDEGEKKGDEQKARPSSERPRRVQDNTAREQATASLRSQELFALLACFVFPIGAAYLLHVIRSQLSRPSESLVSDYNLTIFVLAAEFWPARQVIRLVAARTLHLQRVASGLDDPAAEHLVKGSSESVGMLARIEALEAQLAGGSLVSESTPILQPSDLAGLDTKIQKRLEPRLDSLDRAVRRYEKRYATLAMVTEQRFQNLETRLQDTLSLAAVAAQHSQSSTGIVRSAVATSIEIIILPAKLAWELVTWPIKVVDEVVDRFKVLMLGPRASSKKDDKRKVPRAELRIKDDKVVRDKAVKRLVR